MGIPSEMRDAWASRRKKNAFFIASPAEEQRIRNARNCEEDAPNTFSFDEQHASLHSSSPKEKLSWSAKEEVPQNEESA